MYRSLCKVSGGDGEDLYVYRNRAKEMAERDC